MPELLLVRHGQADSAGENYDQLTPTGQQQATLIGRWLKEKGYQFDRYFHGGLVRQRQTLEAIRAEMSSEAGLSAMEIHDGLAEFDLKVWAVVASHLRHGHAEFAALLKQWNKARHENATNKGDIFKQLTGIILQYWVAQGENFTEAESFPAFRRRVLSVMEIHSKQTPSIAMENHSYLAVTSGGPISVLTGEVLGLDLPHTLGLMRRIYNTSLHHYTLRGDRWDLVAFNAMPHLALSDRTLV